MPQLLQLKDKMAAVTNGFFEFQVILITLKNFILLKDSATRPNNPSIVVAHIQLLQDGIFNTHGLHSKARYPEHSVFTWFS